MTKLINNVLTVSNLRNIVEAFALAKAAGVDLRALQGALAHSSGGSFILQAIGHKIGPGIAEHIAALNRKDVHAFAEAMRARGLDPATIEEWAISGPDGLPALVNAMTVPTS
ncbi:NAD-binding protein [Microvirga antarctica]|uniref:NAD-binding protein n=1 Tax=Microvirga antarctica TaxID=2819233 RepID=UPI001B30D3A0|nr:NAD-binding protein [Microvirga antarctica]